MHVIDFIIGAGNVERPEIMEVNIMHHLLQCQNIERECCAVFVEPILFRASKAGIFSTGIPGNSTQILKP